MFVFNMELVDPSFFACFNPAPVVGSFPTAVLTAAVLESAGIPGDHDINMTVTCFTPVTHLITARVFTRGEPHNQSIII